MVCCVTGHRPQGFPFEREMSKCLEFDVYINKLNNITKELISLGYNHFITGMAEGADIDFAQSVLLHKGFYDYIKLEAALPFPVRESKTITEYIQQRDSILQKCDIKTVVSPFYFKGCMQKRNRYMVDNSDIVLAVWNGRETGGTWNTIKYARSKNKQIRYIMLNDILV